MNLTREHIVWAYRLFLDREPESERVIDAKLKTLQSVRELQRDFAHSAEFRSQIGSVGTFDATNVIIKEIADGLRLFVDLADTHIGLNVIHGSYEPAEEGFIRRHLRAGDTAIDVGANIGFFSVSMAARVGATGRVFAFEPLPRNAALLERSIRENAFETRITLEIAAVGEEPGQLELISPVVTNNWGGPYLRIGNTPIPPDHEVQAVAIVKLDDYPFHRPISFIKLDAEGAELLALRGARRLLMEDRPTILAEVNPKQLLTVSRCSASDLIVEMAQLGYECFPLGPGGLQSPIDGYDQEAIMNVAFLPE